MVTKYRKLRGRIVEKYGSLGAFADEVGLSRVAVSLKLNGHTAIKSKDIRRWAELLGIEEERIGIYFFE